MPGSLLVLDDVLFVGQRVFFYPEPHRKGSRNLDGVIRGWQRDAYILLELLTERDRPTIFRHGASCSIRFLKEGRACAVDSVVLDSQMLSQRPTVRIAWTDSVRTASLRRAERIEVSLPCTLATPDGEHAGQVRDMSTGGIAIACDMPVEVGARLTLACRLPDGVALGGTPVVVRNVRRECDGHALIGCAFADESDRDAQAVGFYVTSTLLRHRGAYAEGHSVLIVDHDAIATALMQKRLHDFGCACEVLPNLLDGVFRARLSAPTAILLRYDWGDLTGTEVCRMLRSGHALASTAIFVHGAGALEHELEIRRAGGTGCLESLARPNEVLDRICTQVPQLATA